MPRPVLKRGAKARVEAVIRWRHDVPDHAFIPLGGFYSGGGVRDVCQYARGFGGVFGMVKCARPRAVHPAREPSPEIIKQDSKGRDKSGPYKGMDQAQRIEHVFGDRALSTKRELGAQLPLPLKGKRPVLIRRPAVEVKPFANASFTISDKALVKGHRNREHLQRLADALTPDPKNWTFTGRVHDRKGENARCACGHPIRWEFVLARLTSPGEASIGSVCIRTSVPWLIEHGAGRLAAALTTRLGLLMLEIAERKRIKRQKLMRRRLAAIERDWSRYEAWRAECAEFFRTTAGRKLISKPSFLRWHMRRPVPFDPKDNPGRAVTTMLGPLFGYIVKARTSIRREGAGLAWPAEPRFKARVLLEKLRGGIGTA